jgi:hypothetical protein
MGICCLNCGDLILAREHQRFPLYHFYSDSPFLQYVRLAAPVEVCNGALLLMGVV